jgi:hypothetical protein
METVYYILTCLLVREKDSNCKTETIPTGPERLLDLMR